MITFAPEMGWWSPAVFWYVVVGVITCLGFTLVVFIGGAGDLVYLLKSLGGSEDANTEASAPNSPGIPADNVDSSVK